MKKNILVIGILLLTIWITVTYPKIGHIVLSIGTALESNYYGLVERTVRLDGLKLSYYENDSQLDESIDVDKPTLLLLHGYSSDKFIWARFAQYMTEDYRVIIPDMAGHGESEYSPELNYSALSQVDWLIKLLDHLKIKQLHVAGNSMGGFIAAHMARLYPNRILSVVLVDPAGVQSPNPSKMEAMLSNGKNPFFIHNRSEFDEFYSMVMAKPPPIPGFVLAAVSEQYQLRRTRLEKIFNDFHEKNQLDNALNEIKASVLLIWGGQDQIIDPSSAQVWQDGIEKINTIIWQELGHMSMAEDPERTAKAVQQFLNQLDFPVNHSM